MRQSAKLRKVLFATVENENLVDAVAKSSTEEAKDVPPHEVDQVNTDVELESSSSAELSGLEQLEDQGGDDNDWSPEKYMDLHYVALDSLDHLAATDEQPFYAKKTTSIAGSHTNGVVKTNNGLINGKNGAHPSLSSEILESNGETQDESDSLSEFDGFSDYKNRQETSKLLSTEELPSIKSTTTRRPSRKRRFLGAARRVWGYVSPVQIFWCAYEDGSDIPLSVEATPVDESPAEETTAEKQRTKEAATVKRRSRRKKKQLSNLLKSVNTRNTESMAGITSRTMTGLISALAEEADGISVRIDAREDTPLWRKQINSVSIEFTRLGFKPLYMGGPDQLLAAQTTKEENTVESTSAVGEVEESQLGASSRSGQQEAVEQDDDSCPVQYTFDADGVPVGAISCADTAFQQIDVDNSGALDKDEMADALVMAATASSSQSQQASGGLSKAAAEVGEGSRKIIKQLAKQLVDLYDTNDDGVIDRLEYQSMVDDMAALRQVQKEREQKQDGKSNGGNVIGTLWNNFRSGSEGTNATDVDGESNGTEETETALQNLEPETTGKIVLENVKIDLRQLIFGAIPVVKHITPGGPLFLEPLKATVTASFTAEDIMKSTLLDAGLRQLVSFALRVRVRSLRDLTDGAVFYGRKWKRDSVKAPRVECTELVSVEIDDKDRAIITGRAKVRTSEDAPEVETSFKLRTKVATPRNGRAIKLSEPEIALVLECPKQWEQNVKKTFAKMKMRPPSKPKPIYTYIPIHSPFKKNDDTGGYYMGEDNRLKSMYIKDKCLRFEMEAILRPGKFLGSHYLAFTVPQRALIITVDRVTEGMRAARRRKKKLKALKKARAAETDRKAHHAEDALALNMDFSDPADNMSPVDGSDDESDEATKQPSGKGFISRFVDGYVQAGESEHNREKLAHAISDWFGRQGISDSKSNDDGSTADTAEEAKGNEVVEEITLNVITDDNKANMDDVSKDT